MKPAVARGQGRWSTAIALTLVVLFLSIFDAVALVLLPVALMLVALPAERRMKWVVAGMVVWLLALLFPAGPLAGLSRGWGLMLGSTFLALSVIRSGWSVMSRALATVGVALGSAIVGLVAAGQLRELDGMIREHFRALSTLTIEELQTRLPDSAWVGELAGATEQIANYQADLFPALLALQSLAALGLAAWWISRLGRSENRGFALGRIRDFRFNDQLIWLLIVALVLLLIPTGEIVGRIAMNGLVFMGALYALRGLAVFLFLAAGSGSIPTMVFGVFALIFLYPIAFTAALLMGLGDTWLDVRRRVTKAAEG